MPYLVSQWGQTTLHYLFLYQDYFRVNDMTRLESDLVQTGVCEKGGKRSILVVQKRRLTRRPKSNDVLRQHKDYDRWTIFSSIFIIFGKIRFCAEKKKRGDGRRKKSRGARFEENVGRTLGLTFFLSLSLSSRMRLSKLAFRVPPRRGNISPPKCYIW